MSNKYLENIGANCNNCGNRGVKGKCNQKCINNDSRPGWDPAPGIKVTEHIVWHGNQRGFARQVVEESEAV